MNETEHERPVQPLGVRLLIWIFWFWAGASGLLLLGIAVGDGPVLLSGRSVPRSEALRLVGPVLLPMALAVMGAALALAQERAWARPAALLPFILAAFSPSLSGLGGGGAEALAAAFLVLAPLMALLVWYLYARPSSRRYFQALRERRTHGDRDGAPGEEGAPGDDNAPGERNAREENAPGGGAARGVEHPPGAEAR